MVEDDDDSDYGHSKKRSKKVIRRGRPDKKEKKSPKPRLKATGQSSRTSAIQLLIWTMLVLLQYQHNDFGTIPGQNILSQMLK